MYYKENCIRRNSRMSLAKFCISFLPQRFRPLSLLKIILLIIVCSLLLLYIVFINKESQLCDPTEHLNWFCSWPDPETTVCSWDDHFPARTNQIR
jgi:hypothetical protein